MAELRKSQGKIHRNGGFSNAALPRTDSNQIAYTVDWQLRLLSGHVWTHRSMVTGPLTWTALSSARRVSGCDQVSNQNRSFQESTLAAAVPRIGRSAGRAIRSPSRVAGFR